MKKTNWTDVTEFFTFTNLPSDHWRNWWIQQWDDQCVMGRPHWALRGAHHDTNETSTGRFPNCKPRSLKRGKVWADQSHNWTTRTKQTEPNKDNKISHPSNKDGKVSSRCEKCGEAVNSWKRLSVWRTQNNPHQTLNSLFSSVQRPNTVVHNI